MKTNKNLINARATIKKLRKELTKYRKEEKTAYYNRLRGTVSSDGHDGRPW